MVAIVVAVVVIAVKRHERFKHERGSIGMSISCAGHLRAWLIEDVETQLRNQSESTVVWAERLIGSLLSGLTVPEIFLEASNYQSEQGFKRFLVWSLRNYPAETLEAVTRIIGQQEQADHAVHSLAYGTSYSSLLRGTYSLRGFGPEG